MGHSTLDRYAQVRHIGEFIGIIGVGKDGLRQVLADLRIDHIESCAEFHVMDVIAAQVDVHDTWDAIRIRSILIKLHPLDERRSTIADPDDCNPHFVIR